MGEALRRGAGLLREAGVDSPALDARLLLAHARNQDQAALLRDREAGMDWPAFEALLGRRAAREPVALITGRAGFWSLEFLVSGATLVPRADTETLIEAAMAARAPGAVRRVLDLGTGTGCLLLAALTEFPAARGVGVDVQPAAAALARENARRLGLSERAVFLCGRWAAAVAGGFDLVLSNPPYIPAGDIAGLMPEVARYEPASALDGGADGLDAYRALMAGLPGLLAPGGLGVLEVGAGQAAAVMGLAAGAGLEAWSRADLAGVERAVLVQKPLGIAPGSH